MTSVPTSKITNENTYGSASSSPSRVLSSPRTADAMLIANNSMSKENEGHSLRLDCPHMDTGYTLATKVMKQVHRKHLLREAKVYRQLRSIRGHAFQFAWVQGI
jgi:hypothetical protein